MKKDIIVGLGEIGYPLFKILEKKIPIDGYDKIKKLNSENFSNITEIKFMHICLIGFGKMGTALLEGWSKLSVINQITVVEPNKINVSKNIKEKSNIFFYNHLSKIKFNDLPDVVILAVKPQIMEIVLLELKRLEIES